MQKRIRNLEAKEILQAGEYDYFDKLLEKYPTGILSVVSDTFDLWSVLTLILPLLKDKILSRDGKLVIRPDSGDPVDIICGKFPFFGTGHSCEDKGVIELLWDVFGGTVNEQGYKVLDSHIGAIYGDSINMERAEEMCKRLKAKGFASTNIVLGVGSFTYQYNTRDTFGFAVKATYGELINTTCTKEIGCRETNAFIGTDHEGVDMCTDGCVWEGSVERREIFKDPITDDGTKKSLKGLISVHMGVTGELIAKDQQTWAEEATGVLETVYLDGKIVKEYTLEDIRKRIKS